MDGDGQRFCARGDWCSERTVTIEDGERVITPGLTWRPYCDSCESHIASLLIGTPDDPDRAMGALYQRLAESIGSPLQADVWVPSPFGPLVPLREDIDAHMRVMALVLGAWAARVRGVVRLAESGYPYASPERVAADAVMLSRHITVLLALQPGWVTRSFPMHRDDEPVLGEDWLPSGKLLPPRSRTEPIPADIADAHPDAEIIRAGVDYVQLPVLASGEDAGLEILHMHYVGRRLLLETNPPPEILLVQCRQCTHRSLRRAWPGPDAERDIYSRCDNCHDEMGSDEYDVNAKRWLAYHRAQQQNRPVLGEPAVA